MKLDSMNLFDLGKTLIHAYTNIGAIQTVFIDVMNIT